MPEIVLLPKKTPSVTYDGLHPRLVAAMPAIGAYFSRKGLRAVCTSAKDGKHSAHSSHYIGQALDLRSWGIKSPITFCAGLNESLKAVAGEGTFYIVWESDHIHVEYAAKGETPNIVGYKPGKVIYVESKA